MKYDPVKAPENKGVHNDFYDQEQTMTRGAMPPAFALTSSAAASNPGLTTQSAAKAPVKTKLKVEGVPTELVALLEFREGIRWNVYADTSGNPTGGLGHLLSKGEKAQYPLGTKLDQALVEGWAKHDLGVAWQAAQNQASDLGVASQAFKVALGSMSFQNGVSWFTVHKRTWELMKEHRWEAAATEAEDSDWARETPARCEDFQAALRGLVHHSGGSLAKPFRAKAAEAKVLAEGKQVGPKGSPSAKTSSAHGDAEALKQVQIKLKALGLYSGSIDGDATRTDGKESNTTKGIKAFQQSKGLAVTGEVDAATWGALMGKADAGHSESTWEWLMEKALGKESGVADSKAGAGSLAEPFGKVVADTKEKQNVAGWSVPPLLGSNEFYSQLHPQAGPDKPIPRSVAFSKALINYERGGSKDIYDNSKCKDEWKSLSIVERERKVYLLACKNTCDFIVENAGFTVGGSEHSIYSLIEKKEGKTKTLEAADTYDAAKNRLDTYLEQGIPVVVGMDYKMNGKNASATDHFVVMIGRGEDAKGVFYAYMDVGRTLAKDGTDYQKNRIYVGIGKGGATAENWISGAKPNKPSAYFSLSEVREMMPKK